MNKKSLRARSTLLAGRALERARGAATLRRVRHSHAQARLWQKPRPTAVKLAARFGFPVVLKIVSDDILHKTEAGGVIVGLASAADVRRAFDQLVKNAKGYRKNANIQGVQVQQMLKGGQEVMVGAVTDPSFGKMIAFGIGGVLVEVMKDITFRMAPVSKKDALSMLDSIGAAEVLRGVRGSKGVNRAALADIIVKVSKLVNDFPEIHEVDLNPIFATDKGARAVDVRIVIGDKPQTRQRFGQSEILAAMQRIMNPRAVAVIGASAEDGKIGNSVMKNLINGGYQGAIYPIHPKAQEILGRKAYPSVLDVRADEIDVAVFAIPAKFCAAAMDEVGRKKIPGAVMIPSGFAEVGEQALQDELLGGRAQAQRARDGAEYLRVLLHAAKSLRDVLHALRRQRQSRAQLAIGRRRHVDHRLFADDAHGRFGDRRTGQQIRSRRGRSADLFRAGRQHSSHRHALRRLERRPLLRRSGEPGLEKETDCHAQGGTHGAGRARRGVAHRRAGGQR